MVLDELSMAEQDSWRDLVSDTPHSGTSSSATVQHNRPRGIRGVPHSPPRRLSAIMNSPEGSMRIPASSSISTSSADVFHPSSPPGSSFEEYLGRSTYRDNAFQSYQNVPERFVDRSPPPSDLLSASPPAGHTASLHRPSVRPPSPSQDKPSSSPVATSTSHAVQTKPTSLLSVSQPSSRSSFASFSLPRARFSRNNLSASPTSSYQPSPSQFIPPSGAPGYGGEDHDWNKARFEYDVSSDAQSTSLQLKGVKPGVRQILDEDLADKVWNLFLFDGGRVALVLTDCASPEIDPAAHTRTGTIGTDVDAQLFARPAWRLAVDALQPSRFRIAQCWLGHGLCACCPRYRGQRLWRLCQRSF
jgi:hypothetical protein